MACFVCLFVLFWCHTWLCLLLVLCSEISDGEVWVSTAFTGLIHLYTRQTLFLLNSLYDCRYSLYDITYLGIWARMLIQCVPCMPCLGLIQQLRFSPQNLMWSSEPVIRDYCAQSQEYTMSFSNCAPQNKILRNKRLLIQPNACTQDITVNIDGL